MFSHIRRNWKKLNFFHIANSANQIDFSAFPMPCKALNYTTLLAIFQCAIVRVPDLRKNLCSVPVSLGSSMSLRKTRRTLSLYCFSGAALSDGFWCVLIGPVG